MEKGLECCVESKYIVAYKKEIVMNVSLASLKKTVYEAILPALAIAILTSCTAVKTREGTSTHKQDAAFETVEKMRGFSMPFKMGDIDNNIRREEIMAEFHRIGKEAIPALAGALKDPDVQMRRNATFVLMFLPYVDWKGKRSVDLRAAIPSLISATKDTDKEVRMGATNVLGEIGPDAKEAVPAITRLLKDSEPGQRCASAIALGQIGAAAKTALPALRETLNDPEDSVRGSSKRAIDLIEKACAQNDKSN